VGIKGMALAVLAAASMWGPARAADIAGAKAFVGWLYAHYPTAGRAHAFDPLGSAMPRVFHPSLIQLIKEDERLAGDEVPTLDGDPLCDCQDDGGSRFTVRSVRAADFSRATAVVVRSDDESGGGSENITLDLALVNGQWRIYDIGTPDTPSLRAMLLKSNHERRAAP
jgi:hypothetical protein